METTEKKPLNIFGLVGKNISYSFSKNFFSEKFKQEKLLHYNYVNFDISTIDNFPEILQNTTNLKGLNVTIPYKESVIPFLDKVSRKAQSIGAVNTIKITKKGTLKGYNTDEYGFRKSITPLLQNHHKKALILGTGGAAKAIAYSLKKLNITYQFVSRQNNKGYTYSQLTPELIKEFQIIINCTPLGTFPNTKNSPNIPYSAITEKHLLYDLIYNPSQTSFLQKGKAQGATTCNGLKMLELQAKKAWKIWHK